MKGRTGLALVLLFVFWTEPLAIYAQQRKASSAKTATLSFGAGIVMNSGDVKPAARGDFYLLDRDLIQILTEEGYVPKYDVTSFGLTYKVASLLKPGEVEQYLQAHSIPKDSPEIRSIESVHKHTIDSTITNFGGKGKFAVRPGTYYLFGVSIIGSSTIVWSVKVNLLNDQTITLDNRNAAGIL